MESVGDQASRPVDRRPLHKRAKFIGPMICAIMSVAVFLCATAFVGVLVYEKGVTSDVVALSKEVFSFAGSTVFGLLGLGATIGGAAGLHDGLRDMGSAKAGV